MIAWLVDNWLGLALGAVAVFALLRFARKPGACCGDGGVQEPDERR